MSKIDERLAWASKQVSDHDDARSLYDHNANDLQSENNAEREEQMLYPHISEIYTINNIPPYDPAEANITSSARSNFWARAGDGRVEETRRPSQENLELANEQYAARPDIESHEDILKRSGKLAQR